MKGSGSARRAGHYLGRTFTVNRCYLIQDIGKAQGWQREFSRFAGGASTKKAKNPHAQCVCKCRANLANTSWLRLTPSASASLAKAACSDLGIRTLNFPLNSRRCGPTGGSGKLSIK